MILPRVEELHGANRVPQILASTIGPLVLSFVFIVARVISRFYVIKIWGWDDTLIIIAFLNSLIMSILFMVATEYGQGWHLENVPLDLLESSFSLTYVTLICYQLALALTKLSILVFYLRVFTARRERWLSWGTIFFIIACSIPLIVGNILQCNPSTQESFFGPDVICLQSRPVLISSTVFQTVLDGWLVIMVIPVVASLQIPGRQRLALMAVLSLGIFVIIASVVRITELLGQDKQSDFTWLMADFDTWTVLEVSVGIVCACAPALRPLIQKISPRFLVSTLGSVSVTGLKSTRTMVDKTEARPGAKSPGETISTARTGGSARTVEDRNKKDSWLSDSLSVEHLVLKGGKIVRRTESVVIDMASVYGLESDEKRDEVTLEEGVDGMMRRPP